MKVNISILMAKIPARCYQNDDFTYTIENGMVNASFINVKPSYQYGSYASFFVDNFRNKVVLADSDVASLVGKTYETETVEHGIKVDVSSYTINMVENASEAQSALLSYFTISSYISV